MGTSRGGEFIDASVEMLTVVAVLPVGQVVDGPFVTESDRSEWVFIGYDGNPEGDFEAVTIEQSWAGLGAKAKNEIDDITCAVVVAAGDHRDIKGARDRVYAIFADVEDAFRANPSLGFTSPTVAELSSGTLHQEQTDSGIQVRFVFNVSIMTRI